MNTIWGKTSPISESLSMEKGGDTLYGQLDAIEKKDQWTLMALNNADAMDAMSVPFMEETLEAVDEINADSALRAIMVACTGKRSSAEGIWR